MQLTYVGHATVLIELDGQRVLTDPLLTRWLGPLRRQAAPVSDEFVRDIDAVLLSHLHHDHLHFPSLARLDRGTPLIVPAGVGGLLSARGFREIQEVRPDGTLAWSWNIKDHIDLSETPARWRGEIYGQPRPQPDGRDAFDWAHWNSLQKIGNTLVLSFRHLDAVYAIDMTTSDIIWKLGGTTRPESLTVNGDPESNPFSGQQAGLPSYVFAQAGQPQQSALDRAWAGALTLLLLVLLLNLVARLIARRTRLKG